jgi:hypothetical protein
MVETLPLMESPQSTSPDIDWTEPAIFPTISLGRPKGLGRWPSGQIFNCDNNDKNHCCIPILARNPLFLKPDYYGFAIIMKCMNMGIEKSKSKYALTTDRIIRQELKKKIEKKYKNAPVRIIEELCLDDHSTRIDIAVVNGILHGYEIKSDLDTLERLPKQMNSYNSIFDQITLVVGSQHLYEAFNLVPDHWGIMVAKIDGKGSIYFNLIREASDNNAQQKLSIAKLLWKHEALEVLENIDSVYGYKSKSKNVIHERISNLLDLDTLKNTVRKTLLLSRTDWRAGTIPVLNGD